MLTSEFVKIVEEQGYSWRKERWTLKGNVLGMLFPRFRTDGIYVPELDAFYSLDQISHTSRTNVLLGLSSCQAQQEFDKDYRELRRYQPSAQPDLDKVFPLEYKSPTTKSDNPLLNRPSNPDLDIIRERR